MKIKGTSNKPATASLVSAVAIGVGIFALATNQASATLSYDLRATGISGGNGNGVIVGPKSVGGISTGAVVTLDVWIQITTAAGTGTFGYTSSVFDALSTNGGSLLGNYGVFTPVTPWDNLFAPGVPLDLDADGDLDIGTNVNNTTNGSPKPRAGASQTTVNNSALFTPVSIPAINESGFQFKVGTITFTMTGAGVTDPNIPIGLTVRSHTDIMTAGALRTGAASFIEGGATKSGAVGSGVFRDGGAVQLSLIAVPEPSAFGMVLLGGMGLVGFRRLGLRRS